MVFRYIEFISCARDRDNTSVYAVSYLVSIDYGRQQLICVYPLSMQRCALCVKHTLHTLHSNIDVLSDLTLLRWRNIS